MENCNIPWGYHTMTYKEFILDGDAYICKTIRKSDKLVCFAVHNASNDRVITFDKCMIIIDSENYDESKDAEFVATLKDRCYEYIASKAGISKEVLMTLK